MMRITQLLGSVRFSGLKWISPLGAKLCLNIAPFPDDKGIVMELDKLWHYLKKKKQKIWIVKAYDHHGKRRIDWECGDPFHAPFKKRFDGFRT